MTLAGFWSVRFGLLPSAAQKQPGSSFTARLLFHTSHRWPTTRPEPLTAPSQCSFPRQTDSIGHAKTECYITFSFIEFDSLRVSFIQGKRGLKRLINFQFLLKKTLSWFHTKAVNKYVPCVKEGIPSTSSQLYHSYSLLFQFGEGALMPTPSGIRFKHDHWQCGVRGECKHLVQLCKTPFDKGHTGKKKKSIRRASNPF